MRVNFTVGQRIGIGFALLTLLVLAASGFGLLLAQSVERTINTTQTGTEQIQAIRTLEQHWSTVAATVDRMLLTRQIGLIDQTLQDSLAAFNRDLANLQVGTELSDSAEMTIIMNNLQSFGGELDSLVGEITALANDGRWAQAQARRHTEMASIQRRFDGNLEQFSDLIEANVAGSINESIRLQNTLRTSWIVAAAAALFGGILVSYLTVRSITHPVQELTSQMERVTQRDFSAVVPLMRNDEIGKLSQAFALMTNWLRESYEELEQRVALRTQALQASSEVSRSLSTILELDKLVIEVVEQIKVTFDYYHVHIYLFDDAKEKLVMAGGTGRAGTAMLAANHTILPNQGLVGRAASSREVTLIPDVSQAPNWLPNPLLPDTKAEIAVPIMSGDRVWGVLDVQHNVTDGLSQADVDLLESIANQVAVALRNADLYEQAQQRATREAMLNEINQKILKTTDVDEAMQVAVREVGRALNASQTIVRFTQDDSSKQFGDTKPLSGANGQQK